MKNIKWIVIVVAVLALLGLGFFLTTGVGKVIETPQPEPVDFDKLTSSSEILKYQSVPEVDITLTTSDATKNTYTLKFGEYSKDLVWYQVYGNTIISQTKVGGVVTGIGVVAQGLLSADHSSSDDLYLDGDAKSDLVLSLSGEDLTIVNPSYETPSPVKIKVFDQSGDEVLNTLFVESGDDAVFTFNVASNKKPTVSASIEGETLTFTEEDSGDTFVTMKLTWTPTEEKPYTLKIISIVDEQTDLTEYVVAVGLVVYNLDEAGIPKVQIMGEDEGKFSVAYTFPASENLQPFSLPCNAKANIADFDNNLIQEILTQQGETGVGKWFTSIHDLSAFNSLEPNKGYMLRLKKDVQELKFTVECSSSFDEQNPAIIPLFSLPKNLKSGWNLIGVSGYSPVDVSALEPYAPAYKQIISVVELRTDGNHITSGITKLLPGKAYWVEIQ